MKNEHADKVWADAQTAKGPLDKPEAKKEDGVAEEKKEVQETTEAWVRSKD